jgi:hypothetical protein
MKKIYSILFVSILAFSMYSCVEDTPFPAPPIIANVAMSPVAPEDKDDIVITATVADIAGLQSVNLYYSTNDASFASVGMAKSGSTMEYTGIIPKQISGTNISYYIEAENIIGKKTYFPATAPVTPAKFMIGGAILMHYWHFNGFTGQVLTPNTVAADYAFAGLTKGSILYEGAYLDAINPGTEINAQMGADAGVGLRVRSAYNDLFITAPSTGYKNLEMSFVLSRSGTGASTAELFYSTDGGTNWTSIAVITGWEPEPAWTPYTFELKGITAVNNSANLRYKLVPSGSTTGNLRMDNLTIFGEKL